MIRLISALTLVFLPFSAIADGDPEDPLVIVLDPKEKERPWLERMIGAPPPNNWYWPPRRGAQGPRESRGGPAAAGDGGGTDPGNGDNDNDDDEPMKGAQEEEEAEPQADLDTSNAPNAVMGKDSLIRFYPKTNPPKS